MCTYTNDVLLLTIYVLLLLAMCVALNYDEAIMAQVESIQKEVSKCINLFCMYLS